MDFKWRFSNDEVDDGTGSPWWKRRKDTVTVATGGQAFRGVCRSAERARANGNGWQFLREWKIPVPLSINTCILRIDWKDSPSPYAPQRKFCKAGNTLILIFHSLQG